MQRKKIKHSEFEESELSGNKKLKPSEESTVSNDNGKEEIEETENESNSNENTLENILQTYFACDKELISNLTYYIDKIKHNNKLLQTNPSDTDADFLEIENDRLSEHIFNILNERIAEIIADISDSSASAPHYCDQLIDRIAKVKTGCEKIEESLHAVSNVNVNSKSKSTASTTPVDFLSNLHFYIRNEIFDYLPPTQVFRMKCVSTLFNNTIGNGPGKYYPLVNNMKEELKKLQEQINDLEVHINTIQMRLDMTAQQINAKQQTECTTLLSAKASVGQVQSLGYKPSEFCDCLLIRAKQIKEKCETNTNQTGSFDVDPDICFLTKQKNKLVAKTHRLNEIISGSSQIMEVQDNEDDSATDTSNFCMGD